MGSPVSDILQSPFTIGGIVTVLVGAVSKLYFDGKSKDTIIKNSFEARVTDLKEINTAKDGKDEKIMTLVQLIYNKLESEKRK